MRRTSPNPSEGGELPNGEDSLTYCTSVCRETEDICSFIRDSMHKAFITKVIRNLYATPSLLFVPSAPLMMLPFSPSSSLRVPYCYILWTNERLGFNNIPCSRFLCVTF